MWQQYCIKKIVLWLFKAGNWLRSIAAGHWQSEQARRASLRKTGIQDRGRRRHESWRRCAPRRPSVSGENLIKQRRRTASAARRFCLLFRVRKHKLYLRKIGIVIKCLLWLRIYRGGVLCKSEWWVMILTVIFVESIMDKEKKH